MKRVLFATLCLLPVVAGADEVFLKGGGKVSGIVVERTPTVIVLEVGPGRVSVPLSRVERVVEGRSALTTYRRKAAQLAPDDVAGWLELGRWAQESGLETQAREAFEHVLAKDPQNAAAHTALGNVKLGENWVTAEESYRARGFVLFEGRWVTPAEHETLLNERAQEAAARREKAESDARIRESEAQAAAAEAEARRAEEAAKRDAEERDRVYWPPSFGPTLPCQPPFCNEPPPPPSVVVPPPGPAPSPAPTPRPTPAPTPTPKPKPPAGLKPKPH
jgi:hypothetical protein